MFLCYWICICRVVSKHIFTVAVAIVISSFASIPGNVFAESSIRALSEVALIPRAVLFGNPQRANPHVSPDGKWLAYLAPVDGIMNVWLAPIDNLESAKPVTNDKYRDIRGFGWSYSSKYILHSQDKAGDENWHVYATNVNTGESRDLTPLEKVHARIAGTSENFPDEILIGLNDRIPQLHDLWRVNLETGERKLLQENQGMASYMVDDDFNVRFASNFTPDGGTVVFKPKEAGKTGKGAEWELFMQTGPEDAMNTGPAGFDKTGKILYMKDSRNRDTGGLFAIDLETGKQTLIVEDPQADVGGVVTHPTEKTIQAAIFNYTRNKWKVLDKSIQPDLDYLATVEEGEMVVTGRTLDDKMWTVAYMLDDGPLKFYLYDRDKSKATFLFSSRDGLDEYEFVKMHSPVIASRDGLNLISYLSLPAGSDPDGDGVPDKPLPMVLNVHGGPWTRDSWGFNATHQWLANRGYAVLSVNYRGSTGFGKNFTNASNGEWSGKMHDDLIDAVKWAVEQRIANPNKVAIMGGSYGGYATLVGLTKTPDVFACGVDIVGPSSLVTLLQNIPEYWTRSLPVLKRRMGDFTTEEGRADLLQRSPLTHVDKIQKPLLIGQGANDPRVKQLEADQIVAAMQAKKIPVTYVLFPDEGHGFSRESNRMAFNAVTEAFLAKNLGGRYEPLGNVLEGSSIQIPVGAEDLPSISEVFKSRTKKVPAKASSPTAPGLRKAG